MAARPQHRHAVAAWLAHAYMASGVVLAFLTFVAVMEGDTVRALWLFLVAMVVDGTDGMLARYVQVKRHAPSFDGALLDNIVDYITYAFMPMLLLWSAGYLGEGTRRRSSRSSRCSPRPTSSAGSTRRPTTTCSSASRLLEHRRVLRRGPRPATHRGRRRAAGVRGPGLRPHRLRLPRPAPRRCRPPRSRSPASGWSATRSSSPSPRPEPGLARDLGGLRRLLRRAQPLPDGPAGSHRAGHRRPTGRPPSGRRRPGRGRRPRRDARPPSAAGTTCPRGGTSRW